MTVFIPLALLVLVAAGIWLGLLQHVRLRRSVAACEASFRRLGLQCALRDDAFLTFLAAAKFKGVAQQPTIIESLRLRSKLLLARTTSEYISANEALTAFYEESIPVWCVLAPANPSFTRAVASLQSSHHAASKALLEYTSQRGAYQALSERFLSRCVARIRPVALPSDA